MSCQQPLDLGDAPDAEASLRMAYARCPELARHGITFQRAIEIEPIRRALVNINVARLRARTHGGTNDPR